MPPRHCRGYLPDAVGASRLSGRPGTGDGVLLLGVPFGWPPPQVNGWPRISAVGEELPPASTMPREENSVPEVPALGVVIAALHL